MLVYIKRFSSLDQQKRSSNLLKKNSQMSSFDFSRYDLMYYGYLKVIKSVTIQILTYITHSLYQTAKLSQAWASLGPTWRVAQYVWLKVKKKSFNTAFQQHNGTSGLFRAKIPTYVLLPGASPFDWSPDPNWWVKSMTCKRAKPNGLVFIIFNRMHIIWYSLSIFSNNEWSLIRCYYSCTYPSKQ